MINRDSLYSQACQSKSRRINGGHEWEVVTGGSISLGAKPRRISIVSKLMNKLRSEIIAYIEKEFPEENRITSK